MVIMDGGLSREEFATRWSDKKTKNKNRSRKRRKRKIRGKEKR
jgi:hypothetical protein